MEPKTSRPGRLVVCDICSTKYVFAIPTKPAYYKVQCPRCKKTTIIKVLDKRG